MTEPTKVDDGRAPPWVLAFGALALFGLGAAYAWLRTSHDLEWHAHIGDALAPVASFLSLFAVVGALWSVHVQRQELRDNRRVLEEQRDAQQELATSQKRLARAQERANRIALLNVSTQITQNVAVLKGALSGIRSTAASLRARDPLDGHAYDSAIEETAAELQAAIVLEGKRLAAIKGASDRSPREPDAGVGEPFGTDAQSLDPRGESS